MTVFVIPPDGELYQLDCGGELPLEQAQKIVGGYVECVYSRAFDNGHPREIMILNEEGKLYGLPVNIEATRFALIAGMIADDVIVGPAIVLTGDHRWQ